MSWADQLEELEKDGVSVDQKVIVSGPEKPSEAVEANEAGRKDPRLIIPRNLSDYPGFPADMNKFGSATEFGQAVIMFWAKWRKQKKQSNAKAKKAERKKRIAHQNDLVVGLGASNESESRRDRRQDQNRRSHRQPLGNSGDGRGRDNSRRRDNSRSQDNRQKRGYDRGRETRTSQAWPQRDGWHRNRETRSQSRANKDGNEAEDSFGFTKLKAADISPELILPSGDDVEVGILMERINQLPAELLRDKHVISDSRSGSLDEEGKVCAKKNLNFWRNFIKDDFGLETFNRTHKKSLFRGRAAPLEPQHSLFKQQPGIRSASLKKAGEYKPFSSERLAPVKRPLQQQPQQQKRAKSDRASDQTFAVYVEKFDEQNTKIKMTGKEWDDIKKTVFNAFWLVGQIV